MKRPLPIVFASLCLPRLRASRRPPSMLDPAQAEARLGERARASTPSTDRPIYAKAADEVTPIASLTKLMTAMVVLDAKQPLDEPIEIDMDDLDYLKGTPLAAAHGRRRCRGARCCASR